MSPVLKPQTIEKTIETVLTVSLDSIVTATEDRNALSSFFPDQRHALGPAKFSARLERYCSMCGEIEFCLNDRKRLILTPIE